MTPELRALVTRLRGIRDRVRSTDEAEDALPILLDAIDDYERRLKAAVDALDDVLGTDSDMPSFDGTYEAAEQLVDRERGLGT